MDKAITKAQEGGYGPVSTLSKRHKTYLIDPLFWRALGKTMKWSKSKLMRPAISNLRCAKCKADERDIEIQMDEVKYHQYRFIDHLANGKDIDDFFNNLLSK